MGIKTEEINIKYASKTVFANLFTPDTSGAHPAVIMSHGFNSSYGEWTNECVWFSQHGYTALAIDFCGGSLVSRSSGITREMTVTSETEDLLASLDYIRALPDIDKENIFLLGASQGGFVSALAAARRPQQVRSLALYYPALCIPDDWSARFPDPSAVPETFDLWGVELGRAYADDVVLYHVVDGGNHALTIGGEVAGLTTGNIQAIHHDDQVIVTYPVEVGKHLLGDILQVMTARGTQGIVVDLHTAVAIHRHAQEGQTIIAVHAPLNATHCSGYSHTLYVPHRIEFERLRLRAVDDCRHTPGTMPHAVEGALAAGVQTTQIGRDTL